MASSNTLYPRYISVFLCTVVSSRPERLRDSRLDKAWFCATGQFKAIFAMSLVSPSLMKLTSSALQMAVASLENICLISSVIEMTTQMVCASRILLVTVRDFSENRTHQVLRGFSFLASLG
jgi:hypothetical protein